MNRINTIALMFVLFTVWGCKDEDKKKEDPTPKIPTEKIVELSTDYGDIYIWLYKETPLHRNNFLRLIDSGFLQSTEFHRVIKNFVIQGGDPLSKDSIRTNDGTGGPGYTIPAEIDSTKFKHKYGALAAARIGDATNPLRASSGSQFYIVVNKNSQKSLDGAYTVFGEVIKGMTTADSISFVPKNGSDLPNKRIPVSFKILEKTKAQIEAEFGFIIQE
jgi:cyclophilin family peptidyl-prolyl cis-trans isomerase